MDNRKFTIWALSQFSSLVAALAKNSRVQEDLCGCSTVEFITDLLGELETTSNTVEGITLGNFSFIYDKKTRKTGILNIRSGKFVTTYCSPNDFINVKVGLGVCWAKYNNVERPTITVKTRLSKLKPHDIFQLYTNQKYEFVGTTSDGKYVGRYFGEYGEEEFGSFFEDCCTVWE